MRSERYDRPLTELFSLEDEIIAKTVVAIQVKLTDGEQANKSEGKLEGVGARHPRLRAV